MERMIVKGMYVVSCCTLAAWGAARSITALDGTHTDSGRIIGTIGGFLLFTLLLFALWVGSHGKHSASWAILSYGSWMTIQIMLFLATLPLRLSESRNPWMWIMLVFIACCYIGGGKAAMRGRWRAVLPWWLGSFSVLVPYAFWVTFR